MRAVLLLLAGLIAGPAVADDCDKLPKPSVAVKRLDARTATNLAYGQRTLRQLGSTVARPDGRIVGLTLGNSVARFDSRTPGYVEPGGRWECISPQLTLSFGYTPLTVYVAREFPPGSCAYKEIEQHEQRHVKAYQDHLLAIEPEIVATLTRRFAADGPWRGPAGELRERLQREIDERWLPYVERLLDRVEERQALIDSAEESARIADACGGEIRKRGG